MSNDIPTLLPGVTEIETVVIQPTKAMPREVYVECYRLAVAVEGCERVSENRVLWDESAVVEWCPTVAEGEYLALQNDWLSVSMELPRAFVERNFGPLYLIGAWANSGKDGE